jgi:hypothetical protein
MIKNPFEGKTPVVYDIETYPNYFMACFIGPKNVPKYYRLANIKEMVRDISRKEIYLIGFNNLAFDDFVIKWITQQNLDTITDKAIYDIADGIINMNNNQRPEWYWDLWWLETPWAFSMDVFKIPKPEVGLKERGAARHWPKLQDLPIKPGKMLTRAQKKKIDPYCENDVRITIAEWNDIQDHVEVRQNLQTMYPDCNVLNKHDAGITEEIIVHEYCKHTRLHKKYLKAQVALPGRPIKISECIPDYIEFKHPVLNNLVEDWKRIKGKFSSKEDKAVLTRIFDLEYLKEVKIGAGGLHTMDEALILESDKDHILIEADVSGYYTSLIRTLRLFPGHLSSEFNNILNDIVDQRLEAKRSGDRLKDKSLKVITLSAFGKTGNKYSLMFDELMQLKITLGGQLAILMLMEAFLEHRIKIISGNTDGVLVYVNAKQLGRFQQICKQWEKITSLELEETVYKKYVRRDVNNYLAIFENGKTKEKGIFKGKIRGKAEVISAAIRGYFANGTPVEDFISMEKDWRKFIFYAHTSRGFKLQHKTISGIIPLQNTSRWYISKGVETNSRGSHPLPNVGDLIKYGPMTKKEIERYQETHKTTEHPDDWVKFERVTHGTNSMIVNDLPNTEPEDLNRNYYIQECQNIIATIIPKTKKKMRSLRR